MQKVIVTVLALVFVFGCASLPPAQPIKDLTNIAGAWKDKSGATMDISEDGTYRFRLRDNDTRGTISVEEGKAITNRGTVYTLHQVEGRAIMQSSSRRGNVREWSRVK